MRTMFSIDFGNAIAPAPAPDAPRYASEDGIALALGNDECVFRLRRSGETHAMTTQVLMALDLCREFRTLDEHAATIRQRVPGLADKGDAVQRVLQSLIGKGLLVEDRAFGERLTAAQPVSLPDLRAVFIRACDRPAQLGALLDSLAADEARHGLRRRYVVLDDSRDDGLARRNAELIARFNSAAGGRAVHVDSTRWRKWVAGVERAVPAQASGVRHALLRDTGSGAGFGGGRACNVAALLGAGARYALLDEDFQLPLKRAPGWRPGFELFGGSEMPVHFYPDVATALADGEELTVDPFAEQLQWCGQALGAVLGSRPEFGAPRHALAGLAPSRIGALRADARVIATCNGHRGSSGTARSDWLFLLDRASREVFWRDRDSYLRNLEATAVWSGPSMPRVIEQGHFTPFLLDGTRLLPPTAPSGRSEDLLFGMLCRVADPSSVVLHTPYAIGHVQERARRRSAHLFEVETPSVNHFIHDFLGSRLHEIRAEAPARRLATVAGWLDDLAASSVSTRIDLLDEYLRFARADLIQRLQVVYAEVPNAPVYWQADVRELMSVNGKALTGSAPPRLADWPDPLDAAGCAQRLAHECRAFATLWRDWPALWEHALERAPRWLDELSR